MLTIQHEKKSIVKFKQFSPVLLEIKVKVKTITLYNL